jgi:basic amino acid/polyamine antiporter, APA family
MIQEKKQTEDSTSLVRGLGLLDSVFLLVAAIIGSSIFLTADGIARALPNPLLFVLVWLLGGVISLIACSAFAEIGSMYPGAGGQYVYLREAYGEKIAFLYGWMIFAVSGGGTIAALAVASALFLGSAFPGHLPQTVLFRAGVFALTKSQVIALIMIAAVTWVNVIGVRRGALLQNLATVIKLGAMLILVVMGFAIGKGSFQRESLSQHSVGNLVTQMGVPGFLSAIGVALIAVFWAYDGWVYITWVAGEVKDPKRTVPRAMTIGIILVTGIYVTMNVIYLYALPIEDIAHTSVVASTAATRLFSAGVGRWIAGMVSISCFGAMASCILSGARVYYAMAKDGVFFSSMARVHPRWRTPAFSLVTQSVWAGILTVSGRYDQLFTYVMFMMVASYVLTVIALFVLRRNKPAVPRPYRCFGYPWLPAVYVVFGTAWTINTIYARPKESIAGCAIVLLGLPGYFYWKARNKQPEIKLQEESEV